MAANRNSASSKPTSTGTGTGTTTKKTKMKTKTKSKKPIQNESTHPQTAQKDQLKPSSSSTPKRTKSPGIRLVGSRIYDSKNGKTCHQCRQKTIDFSVSCTNQHDNKKQCTLHLCQACLQNRYGENAEEAAALGDWKCPRCRGICNCSFCMKKRGCGPTGILIHTAKANGFASVSNLLNMNGSSVAKIVEDGKRKKRSSADEETSDEPEQKVVKKEDDVETEDEKALIEDTNENHNVVEIKLPQGRELTNVAGIDMPSGDIGHVLQLFEFCETFGEVLQLNKGQPEVFLRELSCWNAHQGHEPLTVQLHIRLLSLIEEDAGQKYSGKSWEEDFKECIIESQYPSKEILMEKGYDELNFSEKLKLLNFLCDEALCTAKLRLWIEEQNVEEKKKAKEKVIANREKEKNMKKKVQDEIAKSILSRNGVPLSISEQKDLVLKIKAETAQTLANSFDMKEAPQESYVIRSEPILLERNGCKLWKLRSQSDHIGILLQDACYEGAITSNEKWFAFSAQEKALVEEYISASRKVKE